MMICGLNIVCLILFFSSVNFKLCFSECDHSEYKIDGDCCKMCTPGNRVYRDCTEFFSTTCTPCIGSTFLDAPNGLKECFRCKVCDHGKGLQVNIACTHTSDAECEPLEGHFCTENNRGSCIHAQKHRTCDPGKYIKQIGTAVTDTECGECVDGTYSNGSVCQPHSMCEDLGRSEVKPGTLFSDAECGNKSSAALEAGLEAGKEAGAIVGIIVVIIILVAIASAVLLFLRKKHEAVPQTASASMDHVFLLSSAHHLYALTSLS
ncbi:tumor necrosis factor receptor superfamily member 5-like [Salminus brasiliensis]|uniref:tumor necrosis factor receptor superfamily member 5-like n=1 Tax=Salminus brasiliensis TaxID=930266 RepID=UPI003B82D063